MTDDSEESSGWLAPRDSGMAEKLIDQLTFTKEIGFSGLLAFAAVDEFGSYRRAAQYLSRTPQGLTVAVGKLAEALRVNSLLDEINGEMRASGRIARELREYARLMLYLYGAISRLGDDNIRIRYLPHHAFFMAAVEARLDDVLDMHPKTLGEEDRSVDRFQDEVINAVAGGSIDLAIGLPPRPETPAAEELVHKRLYTSRQEAMVPAEDPRNVMTLADLVSEGRMLVPPMPTRSRETLESAIKSEVANPPEPAQRIKREAYGTKVLIQYGMQGLGTVVVPSDIAFAFKHDNDYGGPDTSRFKWIPVVRASGACIYQEVHATKRRAKDRRSEQLNRVVEHIEREVARLGLEQAA